MLSSGSLRHAATRAAIVLYLFLLPFSPAAEGVDPDRLTRDVVPLAQSVSLTLDPAQDGFSGTTRIDIDVTRASRSFRLHALGPVIASATLHDRTGHRTTLTPSTVEPKLGLVQLTAPAELPPGGYVLELGFTGQYARNSLGLYKTVNHGDAYLFTQFEANHARQAFPCWDEPGFKIPWQLTLTVPAGLEVVTNAAPAQESRSGTMKTVHFGRTPPMPSYLVALAVGPLEYVDVPGLAVPGRIVTPRGQTGLAGDIARISPEILARLEEYFGVPYPYAKLDQVAVPEFAFGGMENAGLITYLATLVLAEPGRASFGARRGMATLVAHEMAHMWFGDLVTMAWWDDLWLNESFASWMAAKIVMQTNPEYRLEISELDGTHHAMRTDALPSVRPVRRSLQAKDDPEQVIDELTYNKGQAILTMIESWIGPEKFRAAMRLYFQKHAWSNTTADDLWRAFGAATGEDIPALIRAFMETPGVPLVTVTPEGGDRLRLTQRRFTNLGATSAPGRWQVPVVLQWSVAGRVQRQRVLLRDESMSVELPGLARAEWLQPNADEAGYYRWSLAPALNARLARQAAALTPRERLGLLDNASALLNAGQLAGDEYLSLISAFAGDREPEVTGKVASQLGAVRANLVPAEQRETFNRFSHSLLRPALSRVGLQPVAGEPAHVAPLRTTLLGELGRQGRDPEVIALARDLAGRYLANRADVAPEMAGTTLGIAAYHGDAAFWETVRAAFESEKSPLHRSRLLGALGAFRDESVTARALDYALQGPLNSSEFMRIPQGLAGLPGRRAKVVDWAIQHHDAIKGRSPSIAYANLISLAEGDDPAVFERLRSFLLDPARRDPAADANITKATERMAQRALLRQKETANVLRFLDAWPGKPATDR
ncbi:MAG: M1 family metallopeptidase [Opitutaceae bacterium]|nr:M1 family metallopeptidase [Opitutaceae bacterium]